MQKVKTHVQLNLSLENSIKVTNNTDQLPAETLAAVGLVTTNRHTLTNTITADILAIAESIVCFRL
jgi:hypothetical protein